MELSKWEEDITYVSYGVEMIISVSYKVKFWSNYSAFAFIVYQLLVVNLFHFDHRKMKIQ